MCIKAKAGDEVRIISDTVGHGFPIGSIQKIDHIHEYSNGIKDYRIFDEERETVNGWALTDTDIELA